MHIRECSLAGHDPAELEAHYGAIYALDREFYLTFTNQEWLRFAVANGGAVRNDEVWSADRPVLEAFPDDVRDFYASAYSECLCGGQPWSHEYECSSPDTYRRFHQMVYRLSDLSGLLVINSLVVERPHDREVSPCDGPHLGEYLDPHGIVHMCCHCRRVKSQITANRWDWAPGLVAQPPSRASHGLCRLCFVHYYPDLV